MNQTIEMEVVQPDAKLIKYAAEAGLEQQPRETLLEAFKPVYAKARAALLDAEGVAASVKDATCVTEIKRSRACRLNIRAVRIDCEKIHKAQKESALRFGKAVDGFKNILLAEIVPVEEALQAAEDTAERAEAARKVALKAEREAELTPLLDGAPILADLSTLSPDAWTKLLADHKLLKQAKIDQASAAEAGRLAREEEARRITAENERLKQEAIAREAAAKAEREEAERKLAAERAEAARVAAEAKAKADAEAKAAADKAAKEKAAVEAKAKAERDAIEESARQERLKAQAAAEVERQKLATAQAETKALRDAEAAKAAAAAKAAKKAAAAPDKEKLLAYSAAIRAIPLPEMSTPEAVEVASECKTAVLTLATLIIEKARAL